MRVISGKARGTRLKKVPGDSTRPIMDRVKENLFNILGDVSGERWLDLFAGTGQVGIEALSRGAGEIVFVDKVRPAILTIKDNLQTAKLGIGAQVIQEDAFAYLRRKGESPFDLIYVAPPQYVKLWLQILQFLDEAPQNHLTERGIVVVQIDPLEYEPQPLQRLELYDERRYGNTLLLFYNWP
jgi:16S rRNA (guanine(966)-N(2))-methyltransferase RsmD